MHLNQQLKWEQIAIVKKLSKTMKWIFNYFSWIDWNSDRQKVNEINISNDWVCFLVNFSFLFQCFVEFRFTTWIESNEIYADAVDISIEILREDVENTLHYLKVVLVDHCRIMANFGIICMQIVYLIYQILVEYGQVFINLFLISFVQQSTQSKLYQRPTNSELLNPS